MTLLSRVVVVTLAVALLSSSAEAARLAVKSSASGGTTLANDGTGDVGTTDDSSDGFTTLWSQMGLLSANELLVFGSYEGGLTIDPTGQLVFLRAVATVPLPCPTCSFLDDVTAGNLDGVNAQNVAWYANFTGLPLAMNADQLYTFGLSPTDAAALDLIIQQFGASNVRIGLSATVFFQSVDGDQGAPVFVTPDSAVPEPGSLLLLGTGLLSRRPLAPFTAVGRDRPRANCILTHWRSPNEVGCIPAHLCAHDSCDGSQSLKRRDWP